MKKWQIVLVVIMCIAMLVMCALAVISALAHNHGQETTLPGNEVPGVQQPEHSQKVIVNFADGKMSLSFEEACNCGAVTGFVQTCTSKELALNSITNIKCEDGIFCIKENDVEKDISRQELIRMVNEYEFA